MVKQRHWADKPGEMMKPIISKPQVEAFCKQVIIQQEAHVVNARHAVLREEAALAAVQNSAALETSDLKLDAAHIAGLQQDNVALCAQSLIQARLVLVQHEAALQATRDFAKETLSEYDTE